MNYYDSAGLLVLGSRFRRLSENFLTTVNSVYQQQGINFEAGWFPAFYLLKDQQQISIKQLSEAMGCSHPAASQLVTTLKKQGLIIAAPHPNDARTQMLSLTPEGQKLLKQIIPVWQAIQTAVDAQLNPVATALLNLMPVLESVLNPRELSEKIKEQLNHE
ncbi:MarR family winged helix-turn-helix transcriptional regulator [Mucilaginibacter agri]|uniref:MarR family transcriptional regulator n=1 Tax=Mucilaginibacter agri TaxID=2695265 RepID=A0A966DSH4_9SPHI|nr:MarR family transcriptional regulator [Mucilaginibacter agri]NCD70133.1 MarR family transcriptional regulator [Mucilaginibacter agri]